jgi:hypothetical protein
MTACSCNALTKPPHVSATAKTVTTERHEWLLIGIYFFVSTVAAASVVVGVTGFPLTDWYS